MNIHLSPTKTVLQKLFVTFHCCYDNTKCVCIPTEKHFKFLQTCMAQLQLTLHLFSSNPLVSFPGRTEEKHNC